jgi:predicted dehydrogenase
MKGSHSSAAPRPGARDRMHSIYSLRGAAWALAFSSMPSRRAFLHTASAAVAATAFDPRANGQAGPAKIRIGQIGTAHSHAAGKMETMRKSPEYEVVGVVEPDPERRARAEKSATYAGVPWMTVEQLLEVPALQAVVVETEVKDLVPMASLAIAAGKHVHIEKPGGESASAFRQLYAEAARQKLVIQLGYMLRYNPAFQLCFELLKVGALGEIFSLDASMSKLTPVGQRGDMLSYRGGTMFELGCHVIDAAVHVLGRPARVTPYSRASGPDQFFDNQLAVLEYPSATATIRSALLEVDGGARRQFVVCGTKGTFDIRPLEPAQARLALSAPHREYRKGYQEVKFPKTGGRYDGDFADLARVLRGEKPLAFTPEHDLAVHETVLLASGLPVK